MRFFTAIRFLLVILLFNSYPAYSQPFQWHWAEQAGGNSLDSGNGIALDGSGNCLVTGRFGGSATFGDTTLTSSGNDDVFIAKYDGNGSFLWAEQAGGTNYDGGADIAVDGSGNCLVIGYFQGSATFGDTTLNSLGLLDVFIAKYDANGNFLWAERAGGNGDDSGSDIMLDGSGNCLVTGGFISSASFGDTTLSSAGSSNIFIAKYDANGNFLWAEQAGGTSFDVGSGIALDGSGNCLVTGRFGGSATFGDTTLNSLGAWDIFITKYDGNGNFLWAERAGGTSDDYGNGIALDGAGKAFVTGSFYGSATFGNTTLTGEYGDEIFISRYDDSGNFIWAEQAGGFFPAYGSDIALDGLGNCLVTGQFNSSTTFGDTTLTGAGGDIFIAKYGGNGNVLWVEQAGGGDFDSGSDIAVDGSGNYLVTGYFQGSATFGSTFLAGFGSRDIFIAKIQDVMTGISPASAAIPTMSRLHQNYPNPFNPGTTIKFDLPKAAFVTLVVYNATGENVATLVSENLNAGSYKYQWEARGLASGIYYYRLTAGKFAETRKMVFLR